MELLWIPLSKKVIKPFDGSSPQLEDDPLVSNVKDKCHEYDQIVPTTLVPVPVPLKEPNKIVQVNTMEENNMLATIKNKRTEINTIMYQLNQLQQKKKVLVERFKDCSRLVQEDSRTIRGLEFNSTKYSIARILKDIGGVPLVQQPLWELAPNELVTQIELILEPLERLIEAEKRPKNQAELIERKNKFRKSLRGYVVKMKDLEKRRVFLESRISRNKEKMQLLSMNIEELGISSFKEKLSTLYLDIDLLQYQFNNKQSGDGKIPNKIEKEKEKIEYEVMKRQDVEVEEVREVVYKVEESSYNYGYPIFKSLFDNNVEDNDSEIEDDSQLSNDDDEGDDYEEDEDDVDDESTTDDTLSAIESSPVTTMMTGRSSKRRLKRMIAQQQQQRKRKTKRREATKRAKRNEDKLLRRWSRANPAVTSIFILFNICRAIIKPN
ncbi:hypothetical protein SAMD00019534_013360 [Acytostelium subglobosum LB1]|uniref:hypothetical protein n=1 Tax=Acytostelium subglobosum LB1 TaxID=1410327 RepID=UPI000644F51C|nr:hypothetical protein SAMD00019534_013360 [Acytostelium subglobosum LB1]GAM18161.1 hypothetical protein SAMD00019534_013360 [Acytostelium subglobosum LB1]|eukprot:XP_012758757.1 hypothetical protein SAMD00019534_013360 [Acytostelium subglobosum LB1]